MDLEGLGRAAAASTPSTGDPAPPGGESTPSVGGSTDDVEALCYAGESVVEAVQLTGRSA